MDSQLFWQALGVLAVIFGGILGWLLRLTSSFSRLEERIVSLSEKLDELKESFKEFSANIHRR
jgi:uncharacterized membrane protein YqgA involved in biofilm formation